MQNDNHYDFNSELFSPDSITFWVIKMETFYDDDAADVDDYCGWEVPAAFPSCRGFVFFGKIYDCKQGGV